MHECTRRARMHSRKRFPFCTLATSNVRLPRGRNANVVESASAICANMANSLVCMNALAKTLPFLYSSHVKCAFAQRACM